ncbi:MAG: VWA domain-containing protein [Pseudomonadota bacterium]
MARFYLALVALLLCSSARSETYVQLILDASGSMYNKVDDGRYRIVAAKDVLQEFVGALPDTGLNVGLRVYGSALGSDEDGSCLDSKLVVPMQGLDRGALRDAIRATRAKGSTPIAYSLEQAGRDFPRDGSRCLIVLVTDGKEVCGGDVRSSAAALSQAGCEVDLRIIGFDLSEEAIASFTGIGTFENATSARDLGAALERAVDDVVERDPMGEAQLRAPDEVPAGSPFDVSWKAEPGDKDYITIVAPGAEPGTFGSYAYVSSGNPVKLHAPTTVGPHELRYQSDRIVGIGGRRAIVVTAAEIALGAPTEIEAGRPFAVDWTGPDGARDYVTIVKADAAAGAFGSYQYTENGSPLTLHASIEAGSYELRYQSDREPGVFARRPVLVKPAEILLEAPATIRGGSPFEVQWQGPNGDRDYLTVVAEGTPAGQYTSYDYTLKGSPVRLHAPVAPGSYEIRYQSDREPGIFASLGIDVTSPDVTLDAPAEVAAGSAFQVRWEGPNGDRDYITIVAPGAPVGAYTVYQYTSSGPTVTLAAPETPGEYEIRYQSDRIDHLFLSRTLRVLEQ